MKYTLRHKNNNFAYSRIGLTYCFAAFLIFLGGVAIYTFFRNHDIVLFQVFPKPVFLDTLRFTVRTDYVLIPMLLFNLPDGLWFLSGLLVIRAVWLTDIKWRVIYACIFMLMALSMELLQISESIPGTFDMLDIAFIVFFAFAECVIFVFVKRSVYFE